MTIPYEIDPKVGIQLLDQDLTRGVPSTKFEYVDVTFNSTANFDTDVAHHLNSTNIGYLVVGYQFVIAPATTPCIYQDVSGTARAWQKSYLVLRSNVASVRVTLLLFIKRS